MKTQKRYRWNCVCDEGSCNECMEMSGKILTEEETKKTSPPLHKPDNAMHLRACRCFLSEVAPDELH